MQRMLHQLFSPAVYTRASIKKQMQLRREMVQYEIAHVIEESTVT